MPRRRDVLRFAAASLTLLVTKVGAGATAAGSILAVRVWPAPDYTRVTLEHDQTIRRMTLITDAVLPFRFGSMVDAELELANAEAQRVQVEYDLASARARLLSALGQDRWE